MDAELAAFVSDRYAALLSRAYLLTGSNDAAEDLVQETLARCCLAWRRRNVEDPDAYALRAMLNLCRSSWRHRKAQERAERLLTRPTAAGDEVARLDLHEALWRALSTLSARQRATVVLRYYEGLSETEIAAALGISIGTVRSHVARGLERLRTAAHAAELMGERR